MNPGKRLPEPPEDGLELVQAKTETGGQLEEIDGGFPGQLHLPDQLPVEPENFPATGMADFALWGRLEALGIPPGKLDAEFVLQSRERLADIGHGAAIDFGCPGETSGFDYIAEHPQGSHLHDGSDIQRSYF